MWRGLHTKRNLDFFKLLKNYATVLHMGVFFFPSEFVFWSDNPQHIGVKDELMKNIQTIEHKFDDNTQMTLNASTSFNEECSGNATFLNEPHILQELVYKPFGEMIKEYNKRNELFTINIDKCVVEEGWYTKYKEGGSFGLHNHDDYSIKIGSDVFKSSFSIVYILNDPNEKNNTEFFVPSMCRTSATLEDQYTFYTSNVPEIKEGTTLIFPSSLYHEVSPCLKPGRITIAYNMKCSYM
jgi:hypothetical protein